jgi:hypothetical protein
MEKAIEGFKNVKLREHIHYQIKVISAETGVNLGKLIEMGAQKVIDDYHNGNFDVLKDMQTRMRRDGKLVRT